MARPRRFETALEYDQWLDGLLHNVAVIHSPRVGESHGRQIAEEVASQMKVPKISRVARASSGSSSSSSVAPSHACEFCGERVDLDATCSACGLSLGGAELVPGFADRERCGVVEETAGDTGTGERRPRGTDDFFVKGRLGHVSDRLVKKSRRELTSVSARTVNSAREHIAVLISENFPEASETSLEPEALGILDNLLGDSEARDTFSWDSFSLAKICVRLAVENLSVTDPSIGRLCMDTVLSWTDAAAVRRYGAYIQQRGSSAGGQARACIGELKAELALADAAQAVSIRKSERQQMFTLLEQKAQLIEEFQRHERLSPKQTAMALVGLVRSDSDDVSVRLAKHLGR